MSKKKPFRKNRKGKPKKTIPDPRGVEKTTADLTRLLAEQQFQSMDEANAFMENLMKSGQPIPSRQPHSPLQEAQNIMYDAWEAPNKRQRIKLAREALAISEDCADAYVLLAEESARSLKQAKELYEAGVQAGERALGPELFTEMAGYFWGVLETRPYMRARAGLASCLWELEQRDEAIGHYEEMLLLNPGDNQGLRYILLLCLFEEGLDSELEQLLAAYGDDAAAEWLYTRALFQFHKEGPSRKAVTQLKEALRFNPYVPDYLLGAKRLPRQLPPTMGLGDETEAAHYATEASHLWLQEPGAIDWLRQVSSEK
jgi:tetratricopeptide (TPR) repeat protein